MRANRAAGFLGLLTAAIVFLAAPAFALRWGKAAARCEPPNVFYATGVDGHEAGDPPCCPLVENMCPGGGTCTPCTGSDCPAGGHCAETYENVGQVDCVPSAPAARQNVVLFLTDDQGGCAYGAAGECYSAKSGTPLPAPLTPHLDSLATYGTTFPVAHNTSHWCLPSLAGIITARYQKNLNHDKQYELTYNTYPKTLRSLGQHQNPSPDPAIKADEYDKFEDALNVIGGYCTYFGGKFVPAYADALAKGKRQGTLDCDPNDAGATNPPECGTLADDAPPAGEELDTPNIGELFEFMEAMVYPKPGGGFAYQRFFAWHFPHKPHEPLPALVAPDGIGSYLFGPSQCSGSGNPFLLGTPAYCPPSGNCSGCSIATAFGETDKGGNNFQYYENVWWVDQNVREIRDELSRLDARYGFTATNGLAGNTVIIHFSDNPWFLPASKKHFTENGYRTRIIVYDPQRAPGSPPATPRVNNDSAHSNDILPTVLHYATGAAAATSVLCPASSDGSRCDGKDLVPVLYGTSGTKPTTHVRGNMCGHDTRKTVQPGRERYLITGSHKVGRCYRSTTFAAPTGTTAGTGNYAGFWVWPSTTNNVATCSSTPNWSCCPKIGGCLTGEVAGGLCLGAKCRPAPLCVNTSDCTDMFGAGSGYVCVGSDPAKNGWCRNNPNVECSKNADCPLCPGSPPGVACERTCVPRLLKFYVGDPMPGTPAVAMTDLLLDPHERLDSASHPAGDALPADKRGLLAGPGAGTIAKDMSDLGAQAPYRNVLKRLNCCVDAWWKDGAGTNCSGVCGVDVGGVSMACE